MQELLIEVISLKTTKEFQIESPENSTLANLLGVFDTHIRSIESELNIDIKTRGNVFVLQGEGAKLVIGELIIKELYTTAKNEDLDQEKVHLIIKKHLNETHGQSNGTTVKETVINTPNKEIKTRSENQFNYINSIRNNDLSFGIGPAGTGTVSYTHLTLPTILLV